MGHLCPIVSNSAMLFFYKKDRMILKVVVYIYLGKTGTVPREPYFSMDQINLSNFGRGSPKDHSCQSIPKSTTRRVRLCLYIGKTVFSTDQINMSKPGRGSSNPRTICAK